MEAESVGDRDSLYTARQQTAIQAVTAVADGFGLQVNPILLKDSNHVTFRLDPYPLVARVRFPATSQDNSDILQREVNVAQHLVKAKAPVTCPSSDLPPGPHFYEDIGITFWHLIEHHSVGENDGYAAAESLQLVHEALANYKAELPLYTIAIDRCGMLLEDQSSLPALKPENQEFLLNAYSHLNAQLSKFSFTSVPLHGDCHLGNALMTSSGVIWTDFESVCWGPREWDLTCLPEEVLSVFPCINWELYKILRDLRSFCVAVWCWADPERSPDKREAAEYHLHRLMEGVDCESW